MLAFVLWIACRMPSLPPKSNTVRELPSQLSSALPPFAFISTPLYTSPYA